MRFVYSSSHKYVPIGYKYIKKLKLSESRSEARSSSLILAEQALETFKMIKPMRENIAIIFKRNIILINTITL